MTEASKASQGSVKPREAKRPADAGGEVTVEGTIAKVVYERESFRIVRLLIEPKGVLSVLGEFPSDAREHARVRVTGVKSKDPKFGEQIKARTVLEVTPTTVAGLTAYLSGGSFRGVGKATAERIVEAFGAETARVLTEAPERLGKVAGVPKSVAESLASEWAKKRQVHDLMIALRQAGLGESLADKIVTRYGARATKVLAEQPYQLAEDIEGVGFVTADKLARSAGLDPLGPERMRAALLYALTTAEDETGSTAFSKPALQARMEATLASAGEAIGCSEHFEVALARLVEDKAVTLRSFGGEAFVQQPFTDSTEKALSDRLYDIAFTPPRDPVFEAVDSIGEFERQTGIALGKLQHRAVLEAAESSMIVVTGGPGTGKTTILKAMLRVFDDAGLSTALASPTGRAAKRMQEATGRAALTIHRLLRYSPEAREFRCNRRVPIAKPCEACGGSGVMGGDSRQKCEMCKGEGTGEPYDVIVIDEASMLDLWLADKLVQAIPDGARLVLVGDVDQLPSVGPGAVLRDIIASSVCAVVRLDHIYRQSGGSLIVEAAHSILHGRLPESDPSRDFVMLAGHDPQGARDKVIALSAKVQSKFGFSPKDIQVLVPQRKGDAGMVELNRALQEAMNPAKEGGVDHLRKGVVYRAGDRVMQLKNSYDKGVYNGEVGYIESATKEALTVRYEDGDDHRHVKYKGDELDALRLSYASTIHKAQGSEYPVVIVVLLSASGWMLTKNLVYTAVTRGRKLVVVVTDEQARAIGIALQRRGSERTTLLAERLVALMES